MQAKMGNDRVSATFLQRIRNRFYAIPGVAQWWAGRLVRRAQSNPDGPIPFARLTKPLVACNAALITTGGLHLTSQSPFDMQDPDGDASLRVIPGDVALADLTITHDYYNHSSADRDVNVIFPLNHFRELAQKGVIGRVSARHFGLMGHMEGVHLRQLQEKTAPEIAAKLRADGVDFAFLTPA
jgi:D-proline reductase (dithiol) PrdB